jgi:hypothetical protein
VQGALPERVLAPATNPIPRGRREERGADTPSTDRGRWKEGTVVTLQLTPDDAEVLRMALESYLSDLRMEIADTDSMDFREMLKKKKAVLRAIANQLGADRGLQSP